MVPILLRQPHLKMDTGIRAGPKHSGHPAKHGQVVEGFLDPWPFQAARGNPFGRADGGVRKLQLLHCAAVGGEEYGREPKQAPNQSKDTGAKPLWCSHSCDCSLALATILDTMKSLMKLMAL